MRYGAILQPLFDGDDVPMVPATVEAIAGWRQTAATHGVPASVVDELAELYRESDGVRCLDGYVIHPCGEPVIWEWWDRRELWLGGRDDDVFRWCGGRYCVGDASTISFGEGYELATLYDLVASTVPYAGADELRDGATGRNGEW